MSKRSILVIGLGSIAITLISGIFLYLYVTNQRSTEQNFISCAVYDFQKRTINITRDCSISQASASLKNPDLLRKVSDDGIWDLNSSILVSKGVSLSIKEPDVKWLRIISDGNSVISMDPIGERPYTEITPHTILVFGKLELNGVMVTSWNAKRGNYEIQKSDGQIPRPYITIAHGANASRIADSIIAYLGYDSSRKQGLSFYGGDFSTITGNNIHDMWYGFFSSNVGHLLIENNKVSDNFKYGIDPHVRSHDIVVKNNKISNSRIGLICSLFCSNIVFEGNVISNNNDTGLMLSRHATNSTVRYNNISLSSVGLSISESNDNEVYQNQISKNIHGLMISNNSTKNSVHENNIFGASQCGIRVSLGVFENNISMNTVQDFNRSGICLGKESDQNIFKSNSIGGRGLYGIDVKDNYDSNLFHNNSIRLAKYGIRIYNSTGTLFVGNSIGNTFSHQYLVSGNSTLNLVNTHFLGDIIRASGTTVNRVNISDSGLVTVSTKLPSNNLPVIKSFETDSTPYVANLSSMSLKLYSK
jgi:mannuronan 5-epimerase